MNTRTLVCGHTIETEYKPGDRESLTQYMKTLVEHVKGCPKAQLILLKSKKKNKT